jgi:SAM-dependent methyltransferase
MSGSGGHDFDAEAEGYEDTLNRGLFVSGEKATFFAEARILWLAGRLRQFGFVTRTALDYGCGTGGSTPFLLDVLGAETVVGLDPSATSLEVARVRHAAVRVEYRLPGDYRPDGSVDLAFCNGVFHHISPAERPGTLAYMAACLRPGGLVAFWENNPWNPGTRYVMKRIPFDRDAIPMTSIEARALVRSVRLEVLATDFCFFFPRMFRMLRGFERWLASVPLGAQYLVLCRKPPGSVDCE